MELKEIENIGFNRYLKIYSLIGVSRAHMFCAGGCCSWSTNQNVSYNPWEPVPISGDMVYLANHHHHHQMMWWVHYNSSLQILLEIHMEPMSTLMS